MKILSSNYSILLKNIFNFNDIINNWNESFTYIYDLLKENKKIPTNLKQYSKEFNDKFAENFKVISNVTKFNQQKIKDITYDTTEDILKVIDDETLILQKKLDNIDKKLEDIIFSKNLETTFFSDINKLYNLNEYFVNSSSKNISIYNRYYDIVGQIDNEYLANADTIQVFLNFLFLVNIFSETTNFKSMISNYLTSFNVVNNNLIINRFNSKIDSNIDELKEILTNTILTHNYMTVYPAPNVKQIILDSITDSIDDLKSEFNNHIKLNYKKYNVEFAQYLTGASLHSISKDILTYLIEDESFVENIYESDIGIKEDRMFDYYLSKVNEYNIRNHMFLLYIYRFWIYQFLNIMPVVMQDYIIRFIYNNENEENKISKRYINSFIFKYVSNDVNYTNYANLLNSKFQDYNYIINTIKNTKSIEFAINLFFIKLIDDFLESEQFNNFNTILLRKIFDNLRKDGIVNYDFNWFEKFIYVKLFFKTFFRKKITDNLEDDDFKEVVLSMLNNIVIPNIAGTNIINEEVSGSLGYDNVVFTTLHRFSKDNFTLKVLNFDTTIDIVDPSLYVLNPNDQSIIFIVPPPNGKVLLASYITDYTMTTKYLISKDLTESVIDEKLNGVLDGENKIFYTSKQFNLESLVIHLVDQFGKHELASSMYVVDNVNKKISFNVAPIGRQLLATYYTITVNELASDSVNINYIYKSLLTNPLNMDYTYQFMDSLYYSSLIKETTFDILSTFYLK